MSYLYGVLRRFVWPPAEAEAPWIGVPADRQPPYQKALGAAMTEWLLYGGGWSG